MCSSTDAAPWPSRGSPGAIARAGAKCVTSISAASRPSAAQCSCSTATLWRTVSGSPNRLQASAWRGGRGGGGGGGGEEARGAALAGAADEDRNALLQRPRVARRLVDDGRAALKPRRAGAPHEREQLEGVLETGEALAQRREVPAVEAVLALEPAGAEAAQRAAARQHVERRDDLRQVGDVAVRDAGDERPETDALGD